MENDQNGSGGANANSGGEGEKKPNNSGDAKDTVSYESHQKLLKEKKALAEKLSAYEADAKKREEAELTEKQEFKKLADSHKAEAEDWKAKYMGLNTQVSESRKLNAVLGKVSGKVDRAYWNLIDLEKIAMDPDSGEIDEASVSRYVKEFEAQHSRLIDKPKSGKLPNENAEGMGKETGFEAELKKASTQKEFDAVMKKYGKV